MAANRQTDSFFDEAFPRPFRVGRVFARAPEREQARCLHLT